MQNPNLTILNQHFSNKYKQLANMNHKMGYFLESSKQQNQNPKCTISDKIMGLKSEINRLQKQFVGVRNDVSMVRELPRQFGKIIAGITNAYENYWKSREDELLRNLKIKQIECKMLVEKLIFKEEAQQQKQITSLAHRQKYSDIKQRFLINKHHDNTHNQQQSSKNEQLSSTRKNANYELDLDLANIEISMNEIESKRKKKITEHAEDDSHDYHYHEQTNKSFLHTSRPMYLHQFCDEIIEEKPERKKSQPSILARNTRKRQNKSKKQDKKSETSKKSQFWEKFIKYLDGRKKQSRNKENNFSGQTKQHCKGTYNKQIATASKKTVTSKITDLRRTLFTQKHTHKFGQKLQNFD